MSSFIERIPRDLVRVGPQLRAACLNTLVDKPDLLAWEQEVFVTHQFSPSMYLLAMSRFEKWHELDPTQAIDSESNQKYKEAEQKLTDMQYKPLVQSSMIHKLCPKCKAPMSLITAQQRRSADEGMTAVIRCSNKACV